MITKTITTLNGYAVLTDDKNSLNPLADYIDGSPLFNVTETRWNFGAQQGCVILHYIGLYPADVVRMIDDLVVNFNNKKR